MAAIGDLWVNLGLNSAKFTRGLKRSRRKLNKFGSAVGKGLRTVGTFGAALGGVAAAGLIKAGREVETFNQAMRQSQAIMGDLTHKQMEDMKKAAFEVAKTTNASAEDAAKSFFFLASAGLDAEQSIAALPQVAQFAQAGMFDMATATDLATDAQSALGMTVKDPIKNLENLTRVTDVLVKANTLANASVEQFSSSLTNKAAASARAAGKDIEEVVSVLAALADQGVKGEEAGTALDIIMRRLQIGATKNEEAWSKMNAAVFDSQGNMRNMGMIITELQEDLAGMSDKQKTATLEQLGFAARSQVFIKALLGQGEAISAYETSLKSAGNTTKQVADSQLTPFQKAINRLRGSFIELAEKGTPAITMVADLIEMLATKLEGLDKVEVGEFIMQGFALIGTTIGRVIDLTNIATGAFKIFAFTTGKRLSMLLNALIAVGEAVATVINALPGIEVEANSAGKAIKQFAENFQKNVDDLGERGFEQLQSGMNGEAVKEASDFMSNLAGGNVPGGIDSERAGGRGGKVPIDGDPKQTTLLETIAENTAQPAMAVAQ